MYKKKKSLKISELDDVEIKHKTKLKRNKELSPKKIKALNNLKYLIWGLILFIFIVGSIQMLISKRPKIIEQTVKYEFYDSETETAKSFARAFTSEYLTYESAKKQDLITRIEPFMLNTLEDGLKLITSKGDSKVIDLAVWKVIPYNNEHSDIVVRAKLELTNKIDQVKTKDKYGEEIYIPKITNKTVYLNVPIGFYNGNYIVEDYPSFITKPSKPTEATLNTYRGEKYASEDDKNEIEEVIENYFKTYSQGNDGQISYYFKENQSTKGYEGSFIFNSIKMIEVFKDNDIFKAVLIADFKDGDLETSFLQRYIIEIEKTNKDDVSRYYITKVINRGNDYSSEGEE